MKTKPLQTYYEHKHYLIMARLSEIFNTRTKSKTIKHALEVFRQNII